MANAAKKKEQASGGGGGQEEIEEQEMTLQKLFEMAGGKPKLRTKEDLDKWLIQYVCGLSVKTEPPQAPEGPNMAQQDDTAG